MLREGSEFEVVVKQKDVIDCVTVVFPSSSMIIVDNSMMVIHSLRKIRYCYIS